MCKSWTLPSIQSYHSLQVSNPNSMPPQRAGCLWELCSLWTNFPLEWDFFFYSSYRKLPTGRTHVFRLKENHSFTLIFEKHIWIFQTSKAIAAKKVWSGKNFGFFVVSFTVRPLQVIASPLNGAIPTHLGSVVFVGSFQLRPFALGSESFFSFCDCFSDNQPFGGC